MCMASGFAVWPWARSTRCAIDERENLNSTEEEKMSN